MSAPQFDINKFKSSNNSMSDTRSDLPPGFYICKFLGMSIGNSKASNRLQAVFNWKVDSQDGSECVGRNQSEYIGLTTEKGYDILIIKLRQLGFSQEEVENCSSQESLVKLSNTAVGSIVKMQVEKNGEFTNLKVKSLAYNARLSNDLVATPMESNIGDNSGTTVATATPDLPQNDFTGKSVTIDGRKGKVQFCDAKSNVTMIQFEDGSSEMVAYGIVANALIPSPAIPSPDTPVEELEVESEAPPMPSITPLTLGVNAMGTYKDMTIVGEVKEYNDTHVKIKFTDGKIYPCRRETVKVL